MLPAFGEVIVELVPHCASVAREGWVGDHRDRPLTEQGHRQAARLADALRPGVDAVYASPALRCRQSVLPVAAAAGVAVRPCPDLEETRDFREPLEWVAGELAPIGPAIGGAWAAGRAVRALARFAGAHPGGRVVASSHGDVISSLLSFLVAAFGQPLPRLVGRGEWYRLRFTANSLNVTSHVPADSGGVSR